MKKNRITGIIYQSDSHSVYKNLAIEEYLMHICEEESLCILYLWQNKSAVVIGRNQNAYTECDIEYAKNNDIQIARRTTGGGAVYHDLGNINFSIILPRMNYNPDYSTDVITAALKKLGINAERNGRNDICLGGKKISGNAYYSNDRIGLHHGTVLYESDLLTMNAVLSVSPFKLSRHGIPSVKSRVGDIASVCPSVSINDVCRVITDTFITMYALKDVHRVTIKQDDLRVYLDKFESENWNLGKINDYEQFVEDHLSCGHVRVSYLFDGSKLRKIEISSDALCADLIDRAKELINHMLGETGAIELCQIEKIGVNEYEKKVLNEVYALIKEGLLCAM